MEKEKKTDYGLIVVIIAMVIKGSIILFTILSIILTIVFIGLIGIIALLFITYIPVQNENFILISDQSVEIRNFENEMIETYEEFNSKFDNSIMIESDFDDSDYYVFEVPYSSCHERNIKPTGYDLSNGELTIDISYTKICSSAFCDLNYKYYALRLPKGSRVRDYDFNYDVTNGNITCPYEYVEDKPMIYIYPEKDMNVKVKLGYPNKLLTSYPKYEKEWNVYAHTNGDLEYNGRTYYGLFWEGKEHNAKVEKDGFIIEGENTSKFLEEKLEILGLNEKEINEFIIYWLPQMEHNKYNYIRFETKEEIDSYMPLEVTPVPNTIIRVYMDFKPLDKKIDVEEQKLDKVTRNGYSVIEWGGSKING